MTLPEAAAAIGVPEPRSTTRPLLFVSQLLDSVDPTLVENQDLEKKVMHGVNRVLSMQTASGGFSYWPGATGAPLPYGAVTIGPYIPGSDQGRRELPRFGLSRSVSPGESIGAELRISAARLEGASEVAIDLVREGMAWFADYGSTPLAVPLPDRG